MVWVEEGHVPQAPSSWSLTTGPSMSAIRTFPPSWIRKGLISSRTSSTFSHVSSRATVGGFSLVESLSKGDTISE